MQRFLIYTFIIIGVGCLLSNQIPAFQHSIIPKHSPYIMTVNGLIPADSMGLALIHEHVFLDWSGADRINPQEWDNEKAFGIILPYLQEMKAQGVRTFLECTPNYIGRNPLLLKRLSDSTGLQILTNTGFYGARNNAHLPQHAYNENAQELAKRWIKEWKNGVDGTNIRPGFIKIGVEIPLSSLHEKLVRAAAITHKKTGLTIVAHTGPEAGAYRELEILEEEGVASEALVWTHAQEGTRESHVDIARKGAWVSLDGMGWIHPSDYEGDSTYLKDYILMLKNLKDNSLLHRTLISHDAGWYTHGAKETQNYKPYTTIFELIIPELKKIGFTESDIRQLLVENPKQAYAIQVRKHRN
ncbi:MAG: phosphotriesterase [Saprospiraceae bacterium]|nr:phosphotriesterase [Saprospiraceae bacterium]